MADEGFWLVKAERLFERMPADLRPHILASLARQHGLPISPITIRTRRFRERSQEHPEGTQPGTLLVPPVEPPLHVRIPESSSNHRAEALELLQFLNAKANRSFRPVDSTLRPIIARLGSGVSVQDCKGVIARQVRLWKDTEMVKYLRPETLFNATKFESYLGQNRPESDGKS